MNNRLIMISGANGSTGSHLARRYLNLGARLVLLYHQRSDRLQDIQSAPGVLSLSCDLIKLSDIQEVCKQAQAFFGREPDSLIHTASVRSSDARYLEESDPAIWSEVFNTNLFGFTNLLRCILPSMKENGFGRVVLLGSDVTTKGLARGTAYAASKAAMVNLIRSLALENPEANLRFNAISPGPLDTKLEEDYQGDYLEFRKNYFNRYLRENPSKKLCPLAELAEICDLLLSENLSNLNGQEITL